MRKFSKKLMLHILLVMLSACVFVNFTLPVRGEAQGYETIVRLTSPTENETYRTNTIPLNITLSTNIPETDINYLILSANLDGQLGYHDGNGIRLGEFKKPSTNYYTTINVSNGNHLLWVQVVIRYYSRDSLVQNLSQIVNFTVDTGATTPAPQSNTPTSTTLPFPSPTVPEVPYCTLIVAVVLGISGLIVLFLEKLPHVFGAPHPLFKRNPRPAGR